MTFDSPEWLLIFPAILLLGLVIKRLNIWKPLRLLSLLLIALLLAKPQFETVKRHLDLWVLLDRSESTEDLITNGLPEWKKILEKSKPSNQDRIFYVDYAADVSVQEVGGERAIYTGNNKLTRTQLALEDVLARHDEDRPSRIVIFTDGFSTEPLHEVASKLSKQGIPVDFRLVSESQYEDFRVARIEHPTQIQVGEPFLLGVTVKGHLDTKVPLTIYRDGKALTETEVTLTNGAGKVEFTTRIQKPGSYQYSAKITPTKDAHEGNNYSEKWLQVTGGPRVLLVTNYQNDPLIPVLKQQHYEVDVVTDSETLKVGQLAATKTVIFNNVPAHEIPNDFLNSLDFYVREQGGGFLMIGGKHSFAAGGYYNSAIDPILPVSMELKNDHRKLSVAMAIVMDRSGSMAMTVAGGATKMDLANNGAAEAIKLLGARDQIAVYAVDSEPTTVVPLQSIGTKKAELRKKVRKIISSGGGIYVYNGLNAAWKDLKKSPIGTKHIILFSDASDTEQPDAYKKLLAEMDKAGATVSVIGLGSKSDPDAPLLDDIAKLGNGRIFYTQKAVEIPKLFAQETVTLARSAFITDPTRATPTGQWNAISKEPVTWLPHVGGYNLSYAKPDSTTSLISQDEYTAPLLCHWRRGMGRAAAITFPMGGEFSKSAREWSHYGDLSQTLIQWLNGDAFPPGLTVRHKLEGTQLTIDLLYDTVPDGHNWSQEFAINPPRIRLIEQDDAIYDLTWKRISPGHYSLTKNLNEGVLVKGAIQAGNYALPFGPLIVGSNTEWAFDPDRLAELKALSIQTDGKELTDISKAWVRPAISKQQSLLLPLCILLLICILLDALITRTGFTLPKLSFAKKGKADKQSEQASSTAQPSKVRFSNLTSRISGTKRNKGKAPEPNIPPKPTKEKATPQKPAPQSRSERFSKAKKRR